MVIEITCSALNNFFFKADLLGNTTHLHDGVILLLRPESFYVQRWLGLVFKQMQRQCSNPPPQPTQFALILSPLPSKIRYFTPKFREVVRYTYFY